MTTAYKPDISIFEVGGEITQIITQGYSDGRIIQQFGEGNDWVEIKAPDNFVKIVGTCKDCGGHVFEEQEWKFSKNEGWISHTFDEDCTGKDNFEKED